MLPAMRLLLPPLLEDDFIFIDLVARPKVTTVILMPPVLNTANLWEGIGD